MKKLLLVLMVIMMSMPTFAAGSRMIFKTADGATHSINSAGLEIKFVGGNMEATNGTESLLLSVSALSTMAFGDKSSSIENINAYQNAAVSVASVSGICFGEFSSLIDAEKALQPGVYVVKYKSGETSKLIIRK